MNYIHYARFGDIWKHFPLCNFLANENPRYYIETNSALPIHPLSRSPHRDFGIYNVAGNIDRSDILFNSVFYRTFLNLNHNREFSVYPGSPGLAMNILKDKVDKYYFCDIEDASINAVQRYASELNLNHVIRTFKNDSRHTFYNLIDNFSSDDFIHIDPYTIFDENTDGRSYFDVCLDSIGKGIKTMLWYGFDTESQRIDYRTIMHEKIKQKHSDFNRISSVELYLSSIHNDKILINPGIAGCGVLIANMSDKSVSDLDILSDELVKVYENSECMGHHGINLIKDWFII